MLQEAQPSNPGRSVPRIAPKKQGTSAPILSLSWFIWDVCYQQVWWRRNKLPRTKVVVPPFLTYFWQTDDVTLRTLQHPPKIVKVQLYTSKEIEINIFTAAAIPQRSAEAMPPPRTTRSITAQLSRQNAEEPNDSDPLTDLDETPPAKSVSVRKKLPISTNSRHLRWLFPWSIQSVLCIFLDGHIWNISWPRIIMYYLRPSYHFPYKHNVPVLILQL